MEAETTVVQDALRSGLCSLAVFANVPNSTFQGSPMDTLHICLKVQVQ